MARQAPKRCSVMRSPPAGGTTGARATSCACESRNRRNLTPAGSIIELLDMPGLGDFYRVLAARGTALPVPPAHVTLWTHTRPQGIGVADEATLAGLCVREVAAHELGL